jgi:hypothetical protein
LRFFLRSQQTNGRTDKSIFINLSVLIFSFVVFIYVAYFVNPISYDWHTFRDAARQLISGASPYGKEFYNPPWTLIPLIPMAALPLRLGSAVISALAFYSFGFIAYRLGARPLAWALFMISPPVILEMRSANITWLATLGVIMPPQIGIFFVLMKPQVGIGIAIYWLVEAWRRGKWAEVVRIFGPVTLTFGLSLIIFGFWPLRITEPISLAVNTSLWPQSIPIGIVLILSAIRKQKSGLAISASPFLSPYLAMHSWGVAVLGLLPDNYLCVGGVIGLWVWILVKAWL